jgi:hypothetical protein
MGERRACRRVRTGKAVHTSLEVQVDGVMDVDGRVTCMREVRDGCAHLGGVGRQGKGVSDRRE